VQLGVPTTRTSLSPTGCASISLAMPKSSSTTRSSVPRKMFDGLTSRWMMPRA
jgi:hypothetical protein